MMRILTYLMIAISCLPINAQTELSLDECIQRVREYPTSEVKISEFRYKSQLIELKDAKLQYLPNLDFYSNAGVYIGRRVDPITNTFPTSAIFSNGYGLNLTLPLLSGMENRQNIEWNKLQTEIVKLNIEGVEKDVIAEVIRMYYAVLNLDISKKIHSQKMNQLEDELQRVSFLIQRDRLTLLDSLNILSQIGTEKLALLDIEEQLKNEEQALQVKLNLGREALSLEIPDTSLHLMPELSSMGNLQKSLGDYRQKQLASENKRFKQFYLPRVELFGGAGTGYSTNNLDFSTSPSVIKPYDLQLRQNLSQNVGLNVNFPLFYKGSNLRAIKMSEIDLMIQEEELQVLNQLLELQRDKLSRQWIKQSASIETLRQLVEYASASYKSARELYEASRITRFELNSVRNEFYAAQLNYQQSLLERCRLADQIRYDVITIE